MRPVAALLSLRHHASVIYNYGSDQRFHNLCGMPFLFWKLIEESKAAGAEQFDFGRTDLDNQGLDYFQESPWHKQKSADVLSLSERGKSRDRDQMELASDAAERVLYRHMG
jgi:hypothetical protein